MNDTHLPSQYSTIDEYLALQRPEYREALERIRQLIKTVAPEAVETISYQVPMFKYHGPLVGFAAAKKHCSLYPCGRQVIEQFGDELKAFGTSAGTIRFRPDAPLPDDLVVRIVEARLKANLKQVKK